MNEPNHFELPPDVQRLLDSERADEAAPAGARDRVRMRVGATVGLLTAGAAVTGTAKAAVGASKGMLGWAPVGAKVLAPMLVGSALLGGALGMVNQGPRASTPVPAVVRTPVVSDTPVAPAPAAPAVPEAAAEVTVAATDAEARPVVRGTARGNAARAVRPAVATGPSALEQERLLLEEARAALAQGDARRTLGLLGDHDAHHGQGQLREEALALRVMALVRHGDAAGARAAAASFRRQHPQSVLRAAVDAAVAGLP